jgi:uncharacterized protein YecT (DUF1311 family)
MGHAVTRWAAALVVAILAACPAWAQDKPAAKDSAAIEKCVKAKTGRHWAWESCIGVIADPCSKHEGSLTDRQVIDCYDRELAVWDGMLNRSYQALLKALDADQQEKLRGMQRAWIDSRDKSCAFLYDYFQGTMTNPMIAACKSRTTARQALYLRGFAEDVAERK